MLVNLHPGGLDPHHHPPPMQQYLILHDLHLSVLDLLVSLVFSMVFASYDVTSGFRETLPDSAVLFLQPLLVVMNCLTLFLHRQSQRRKRYGQFVTTDSCCRSHQRAFQHTRGPFEAHQCATQQLKIAGLRPPSQLMAKIRFKLSTSRLHRLPLCHSSSLTTNPHKYPHPSFVACQQSQVESRLLS